MLRSFHVNKQYQPFRLFHVNAATHARHPAGPDAPHFLITTMDLHICVTAQRIIGLSISFDVIYCSRIMQSDVTTESKPRDSFHLALVEKSHGF